MKAKHVKVKITDRLIPFILVGSVITSGFLIHKNYKNKMDNNSINEISIEESNVAEIDDEIIIESNNTIKMDDIIIEKKKVVEASTGVNVRSEANTSSEILSVLQAGNSLEFVSSEEEWYKVLYDDKEAYVSSNYSVLKDKSTIKNDIEKMVYFKNNSNLYDEDYTELCDIPKLEALPVYGENEDYYLTYYDEQVGFIKKEDTDVLEGTFAIVDISDQTAYLYENNNLLVSTPVVTGKLSSPTTKGLHEVWLMESNRYLTGDNYKVHVDVVAFFHNGEGIHDASWRSSFGGQLYKNGGSHGCVNMPHDAAITFYDNLKVGDKVLVKE